MRINTQPLNAEDETRNPGAAAFARHLAEHATEYFPDLDRSAENVRLLDEKSRPQSTLYRFRVGDQARGHTVLVKVPTRLEYGSGEPEGGSPRSPERPRLAPVPHSGTKPRLEYSALTAIEQYFTALGDPRFGTIPVLDYIPELGAMVMGEVPDPSFRQLFAKTAWPVRVFNSVALEVAFHNAGAWLRTYHALPKQDDVELRDARRSDCVHWIGTYCRFLASIVGDKPFFERVTASTVATAFEALPEELPLGLGHGDYALRNILVGSNDRVTVLDTLARWRMPVFEDLAYFLIGIRTTRPQVWSQGRAFRDDYLRRCEDHFLAGYFGREAVPVESIRLYEILIALDKWSAEVTRAKPTRSRVRRSAHQLNLASTNRYFRGQIESLLIEARG